MLILYIKGNRKAALIKDCTYLHSLCIIAGDFGNSGHNAANNIYRIPEPDDLDDQDVHIDNSNTLQFR